MSKARRFTSWTIIDSGLGKFSTGFNLWETKALAQELVRRGEAVRILTPSQCAAHGGVRGRRDRSDVLAIDIREGVDRSPMGDDGELRRTQSAVPRELWQRLDPAVFRGALAWFPMVGITQLLGLLRWLAALPPETRPKAAINLFEPMGEWNDDNQTVKFYSAIWKGCPPDVKRNVVLFARTRIAAEKFTKELGVPVMVFPRALPERFLERKTSGGRSATDLWSCRSSAARGWSAAAR